MTRNLFQLRITHRHVSACQTQGGGARGFWRQYVYFSCCNNPINSIIYIIDHQSTEPEFTPEVTEEGIKVVEDLLRTWTSATSEQDGDDIVMTDILSPEVQLEELKKCVQDFRPQIENNPWLRSLITAL
jgi:hypothetical protein